MDQRERRLSQLDYLLVETERHHSKKSPVYNQIRGFIQQEKQWSENPYSTRKRKTGKDA